MCLVNRICSTSVEPNLIRGEVLSVKRIKVVKTENRPELRRTKNRKRVTVDIIIVPVRRGEKRVRPIFDVVRQSAVDILLWSLFLHKLVCGIFRKERKVVLHSFAPVSNFVLDEALSEEAKNKEQGDNSNKISIILTLTDEVLHRAVGFVYTKISSLGRKRRLSRQQ